MAITGTNPVGPAVPAAGIYTTSPPSLSDGNHQSLTLDSAGRLRVVQDTAPADTEITGEVAHDAADAGNPVKIGGKGSAAVATAVTEGDRVNASFTLEGRLRTEDGGDVAHDAADAGKPVKVGGKATAAIPTSVTEGDRADASFDLGGRLRVISSGEEAHDAADAGNPIKIGGKGSAAVAAAVTEGDRVNASFTLEGRLRTTGEGTVAHDAADAGNPLKVGGIGRAAWETAASTAADRVNASFDLYGRQRVVAGAQEANAWSIKNRAAANTAATVSKAAGTSAERHVCTGFMVTFASLGAPTPEIIGIQIRDGATGAGTIIWEGSISLPAVAGESKWVGLSGLWLVGTAATAMTIETDAGGGANDYLSVSLSGVTIAA